MKIISYITITFCLLGALCLVSCEKIIQTTPVSVITGNTFWKSQDDALGALHGMYAKLRAEAESNLFLWGEARSEVMGNADISGNSYMHFYSNELSPMQAGPDWLGLYGIIDAANQILMYTPTIEFKDNELKNRVLAEAYTMRAFSYFVAARTWGDAIIRTEPTDRYDASKIFLERSPVNEVFALIKDDLEKAIQLYPDLQYIGERARWSQGSALALQADVHLWTAKVMNGGEADLKIALEAIQALEESDTHLLDNYSDVHTYANKGNKEIIMGVRFKIFESKDNLYHTMWVGAGRYPSPIDAETGAILGNGGTAIYWAPTSLVRSQFNILDQRRDASFYEVYTLQNDTKKYFASVVMKGQGKDESGVRHFKNDIILYRLADLILMKAEIKNALKMDPTEEINRIRKRAYGNYFSQFQFVDQGFTENDQIILKERLLELAFEGKRWWDLIRFDAVFQQIPVLKGKENQRHLVRFPISNSVLSMEPKVVQNPGY